MIKLTAPNGQPVWINPDYIERILPVLTDTKTNALNQNLIKTTRIDLASGEMQIVQETWDTIQSYINTKKQ